MVIKKVGLFGGAFDPITCSHIKVAKECLKVVDEVWFLPCYKSYYDKKMSSPKDRIDMINLTLNNVKEKTLKLCDFEIKNKLVLQSYDMVKLFYEKFSNPNIKFYFIIGMDNANKIHTWDNFDDLTKMISFIVVGRSGYDGDDLINWYLKEPHIFIDTKFEGSSTAIRNAIKAGIKSKYVDDQVYEYIKLNRLYE